MNLLRNSKAERQTGKKVVKVDAEYYSDLQCKLCKRAHIPLRSTAYRLNYRQYSSKFRMIAGLFTLNLPPLIACSLVCWIFNPLFSILTTLLMFIFLVSYLADH